MQNDATCGSAIYPHRIRRRKLGARKSGGRQRVGTRQSSKVVGKAEPGAIDHAILVLLLHKTASQLLQDAACFRTIAAAIELPQIAGIFAELANYCANIASGQYD